MTNTEKVRELLCQLCNEEYSVWFAPNAVWNRVMRHPDGRESSEKYHFVCPNCFIKEAVKLGIKTTGWLLTTDEYADHHYAKEFLEMLPDEKPNDTSSLGLDQIEPEHHKRAGYNECLSDIKQAITKRYLEGNDG